MAARMPHLLGIKAFELLKMFIITSESRFLELRQGKRKFGSKTRIYIRGKKCSTKAREANFGSSYRRMEKMGLREIDITHYILRRQSFVSSNFLLHV